MSLYLLVVELDVVRVQLVKISKMREEYHQSELVQTFFPIIN